MGSKRNRRAKAIANTPIRASIKNLSANSKIQQMNWDPILLADLGSSLERMEMKKAKSKSVIDEYIGSRIREARLSLNMTQEHLAKALDVSFQQIQKYENGVNGISAVRLFDICKILNVSLASMFRHNRHGQAAPDHLEIAGKALATDHGRLAGIVRLA